MIMKLEMPLIDPSLRGGKVVKWHKTEGDEFGFGDVVCQVAVDEFAALRRTARATKLSGGRRKKLKSDLEVRKGKVYLEVDITSADHGVLRQIIVEEGERVSIGDTLAIVTTKDHGDLGGDRTWNDAPVMRVATNVAAGDHDIPEGE